MHQYFGLFLTRKGFKTIREYILRVARSEIRINELFANRKKATEEGGVESFCSRQRGFSASLRLRPKTFTSDTLSLWQRQKRIQVEVLKSLCAAGGGGGRGANTHQTHEMTVPNEIIGCVIGKGGSKIAEIRCIFLVKPRPSNLMLHK